MTSTLESGAVRVLFEQERTVVVLSGDIDVNLRPQIDQAVRDTQAALLPLELDVRNVTFLDSTGLSGLARLGRNAPGLPSLLYPSPAVDFLLELTDLGKHFNIVR